MPPESFSCRRLPASSGSEQCEQVAARQLQILSDISPPAAPRYLADISRLHRDISPISRDCARISVQLTIQCSVSLNRAVSFATLVGNTMYLWSRIQKSVFGSAASKYSVSQGVLVSCRLLAESRLGRISELGKIESGMGARQGSNIPLSLFWKKG